ncbi:unnamed protein product [Rotaria sordida]|uniref:Uncharacterized protein n=1 Tax=Rotaria sordida TaxID=392033 RepID=A0A815KSB9_9BILA|nr:unnamed protein product [Rotaria sordida]CAF1393650.1 unnamed protein product [Rotaria sordida]
MAFGRRASGSAAASIWAPILVTLAVLGILAAAATVIVLSLIPVYLPTKTISRRTNATTTRTTTTSTSTTTTTLAPTTLSHTMFSFLHRSMSYEYFELFEIFE